MEVEEVMSGDTAEEFLQLKDLITVETPRKKETPQKTAEALLAVPYELLDDEEKKKRRLLYKTVPGSEKEPIKDGKIYTRDKEAKNVKYRDIAVPVAAEKTDPLSRAVKNYLGFDSIIFEKAPEHDHGGAKKEDNHRYVPSDAINHKHEAAYVKSDAGHFHNGVYHAESHERKDANSHDHKDHKDHNCGGCKTGYVPKNNSLFIRAQRS